MNETEEIRYTAFVAGLTELSHKYGFYLQVVGGVYSVDNSDEIASLSYTNDLNSGDLLPIWK